MSFSRCLLFALGLFVVPALAPAADAKPADKAAGKGKTEQAAAPAADNVEALAEKARADKKVLIVTNLLLTETEAKAFWPVYDEYQAEIIKLNTREVKAIVDFTEAAKKGTPVDDAAKKFIADMLACDQAEANLRKTMAPKLLSVLPPLKVARYLQLEDRIRLAVRGQLAARTPVAGGPLAGIPGAQAAAPAKKP